jgi:lambda family phage portal protein
MLDWPGKQRLALRTVMESGEALVRIFPRDDRSAPLTVEVLEPDYIDIDKTEPARPGRNVIIQGVEFNARGERVAYWMFDHHPGDRWPLTGSRWRSRRVPASVVFPVMRVRRPGQIHGVPWLGPAIMKLKDIDELEEARFWRKRIEACFAAFVRTDGDTLTGMARRTEQNEQIETMKPGGIYYLNQGEQIEFHNPSASEGDTEWLVMQLHAVAAAFGVPYHLLTGDLRQANYSSLRAGNLDLWALIGEWQTEMLIPQMCRPVWRAHDAMLYALGTRDRSFPAAIWDVPEQPLTDPHRDAGALLAEVRMGRKTMAELISARGRDPIELLDELAEFQAELDRRGIMLDSDGRRDPRRMALMDGESEKATT